MRVLVVDDDELIREQYGKGLSDLGHSVSTCDGHGALQALIDSPVDAMVVDILMPGVDGIEVIAQARERLPSLRIVAVSGGGKVSAELCLKLAAMLGADASLQKPIAATALADAIESSEPGRSPPGRSAQDPINMRPARPSILAVDDDPLVLEMIQLHLWDYDVRVARGGDEALAILGFARPALILLDVNMPGLDGIETLKMIRKRGSLANSLVLMLTAKADRGTISRAQAEGSDGYLLKPFTRNNLTARIRQMLTKAGREIIKE